MKGSSRPLSGFKTIGIEDLLYEMKYKETKLKEIAYYDHCAREQLAKHSHVQAGVDFEGFNPLVLKSFRFCYELVERYSRNKRILDYGCGNGIHAVFLAKIGREVVGVDLSKPSLELAHQRMKGTGLQKKTSFLVMDCEHMDFPKNSFDVAFDGGTMYALNLEKAFPEVARVLKPEGIFIGIETLGHNPFTNIKRKINYMRGKRTAWALEHIFQMRDIEKAQQYFERVEPYFFHLLSWVAFPFLFLPGGKILLWLFELIEQPLLRMPWLKKYAFKVVLVCSIPKRPQP